MANTPYLPEQMAAAILALPGGALQILVTAPTGATVTAAKGSATYYGVYDEDNDQFVISVPEYGTYSVSASIGGLQSQAYDITITPDTLQHELFPPPDTYQMLEYLEATGGQYISTGLGNSGYGMRYTGKILITTGGTSSGMVGFWGAAWSGGNYIYTAVGYNEGLIVMSPKTSHTYKGPALSENVDYRIDIDAADGAAVINGEDCQMTDIGYAAGATNGLTLFNVINQNGGATFPLAYLRIYSGFGIYSRTSSEGDYQIFSELYAVRRKSDNVLGMYDVIRERFLPNAGTGEFIAGPDVTL